MDLILRFVQFKRRDMRKLLVFNSVSIDGYFTDKKGDMSWAHRASDPEWDKSVQDNSKSGVS